jgi:4-carboxymuconolactone decarboxylase
MGFDAAPDRACLQKGDPAVTRIAELEPASMSGEQRRIYEEIGAGPRGRVAGPLSVWLHRPGLADPAQKLGRYVRYETALPARLSELAILVTARLWGSEYEWQAHKGHALKAGLSPKTVEAIRAKRRPDFETDDEAVVYDFAVSLDRERRVPDALYRRAVAILKEDGVVDLVGILGYYTLISMTINAFEIAPPPGQGRELD